MFVYHSKQGIHGTEKLKDTTRSPPNELVKAVLTHHKTVFLIIRWVVLLADDHEHFSSLRLTDCSNSYNGQAVCIDGVYDFLDCVAIRESREGGVHLLNAHVVEHDEGVELLCCGEMDGFGQHVHVELQVLPVLQFQRSLHALHSLCF